MLEGCVAYPQKFAERYAEQGYWEGLTFTDLLDRNTKLRPDDEALVGGAARLTWRQLRDQVDHLARHLLGLGLRPRERVILQLPNVPELVVLFLALGRMGAIGVTCLPPYRQAEILPVGGLTEAAGYAIAPTFRGYDYLGLARDFREAAPSLRYVFTTAEDDGDGTISLPRLLREPLPASAAAIDLAAYRPDPSDIGVFQLSGGTTGVPKVIPRTYDDYIYNADILSAAAGHGPESVSLIIAPVAHNAPLLAQVVGPLYLGCKIVLSQSAEPEEVFRLIERERATHTFAVPAMLVAWFSSTALARFDLSSLEAVISGGAKVLPELARRVGPKLGCRLCNVFGMAEGFCTSTRPDSPEDVVAETVGRPLSPDDEFRIVDDAGREVAPGERGELLVRGPYTIRGFYKVPEINREAFTADGFYRTGDMLRVDARGNLVVEGRKKDLINRGGEKISSEEIEELLLGHPKLENVAVVAMPDPVLGERACLFAIPRPGETLTLEEVNEFLLAKQIAKFKLPERLEIVDRFPLTSVGKISKKALRDEAARGAEIAR